MILGNLNPANEEENKVIRAMVALDGNESWKVVKEWVNKRLTKQAFTFCLDSTEARWKEGGLGAITELLLLIENAREGRETFERERQYRPID